MTTLDSVEAELAAAHEAVELHREVTRHQAEEIARLTLERDRALACEAAALGLLPALRARLAESEAEVGAIRASAQSMVEAWRDASQDRVKMVREQGFTLGVEHCALELEKAITEEPAWESATWRQRAEAAEKQLADSERKMGEIVSSDWTGSEALRARLSAATRVVEALRGLKYRDEPGEPDRYCDHAAEPCPRCELARAALREWKEGSKPALAAPVEPAPDEGRWTRAFGYVHGAICPTKVVNADDPMAMAREIVEAHKAAQAEGAEWMREQAARAVLQRSAVDTCSCGECDAVREAAKRVRSLPTSPPANDPFVPGEPTPALLRALASRARTTWCPRPHHLLLAGEKCPTCGEPPPAPEEAK